MIVSFDAKAKNDYGYTYDNIILNINQSNSFNNRISVSAHIKEDFSAVKASGNAPVASFETKSIDFGNLQIGKKADCDFVLKNTGKSNLIVRKTKASCGCTAVTLGETTIAPGASTTIRASFDSSGKSGRQQKSITVITNDPANPETHLTIMGSVVNS
jgi:hypothetical protein